MGSQASRSDVVIVGGGIMGCATAYYLAKRRVKACLIERNHAVGLEASGNCGGGCRQQGREGVMMALGRQSIRMWLHLRYELNADLQYWRCGNVFLALSPEDMDHMEQRWKREREAGLIELQLLDKKRLKEILPAVSDEACGGTWCPTDGTASPLKAAPAFARAAERLGARILTGTTVAAIRTANGAVDAVLTDRGEEIRTPVVVNCAGSWAGEIGKLAGVDVPVVPNRSQIMVTEPMPPVIVPFVALLHGNGWISQRPEGQVFLGHNSRPLKWHDRRATWNGFVDTTRVARKYFPVLRTANIIRGFAGLTEWTPDGHPIIGPVDELKGFYVAAGYCGGGFALGPVTGKTMSELILDGRSAVDVSELNLRRFRKAEKQVLAEQ